MVDSPKTVAAVYDRRFDSTALIERRYRNALVRLPARAARGLVWVYQRTVSPALTAAFPSCGCRFAPTCSHYAREALQEHGFLTGSRLTVVRLAKCGPWHAGGADPVPPRQRPVCSAVISA